MEHTQIKQCQDNSLLARKHKAIPTELIESIFRALNTWPYENQSFIKTTKCQFERWRKYAINVLISSSVAYTFSMDAFQKRMKEKNKMTEELLTNKTLTDLLDKFKKDIIQEFNARVVNIEARLSHLEEQVQDIHEALIVPDEIMEEGHNAHGGVPHAGG